MDHLPGTALSPLLPLQWDPPSLIPRPALVVHTALPETGLVSCLRPLQVGLDVCSINMRITRPANWVASILRQLAFQCLAEIPPCP